MAKRGIGGRAIFLSGQSGTGKTSIAYLIAREIADEFGIDEIDAQHCTPKRIGEIERSCRCRSIGGETIKKVNLESVIQQPIETLSKGFKRRVGLAQAILHDPSVLILDEPTDGLDPNQKHEVRALIKEMAMEKAIILSTHILEEVQAVCTRAIIIAKGKVITDGTPAELEARSRYHNAVVIRLRGPLSDGVLAILENLPGVKAIEELHDDMAENGYRVIPENGQPILSAVSQCVQKQNWDVAELSVDRGQLDEVFRSLTMPTQELT